MKCDIFSSDSDRTHYSASSDTRVVGVARQKGVEYASTFPIEKS